jgi:hypothetical protein
MSPHPILLAGGAGIVGRHAARELRVARPQIPLLMGGRDIARAEEAASAVGHAEGVTIDLEDEDLGLDGRPVSAVAVLFTDTSVAGLRFAQARGIPYISISPGIVEFGPEVATFIHNPRAAPVVLGTEWLVGATSIPTLEFAKRFAQVDNITIGRCWTSRMPSVLRPKRIWNGRPGPCRLRWRAATAPTCGVSVRMPADAFMLSTAL